VECSPDPAAILAANESYSTLGRSLVFGELDGDGLPDLVVGAPGARSAGCIYIFFGRKLYYTSAFSSLLNVTFLNLF
jgi:hypothetical protein